jgi:hypothetical protein
LVRLIYGRNIVKPAYSYATILSKNVRMVTSKQRTIAISAIAIVAVLVLFASAPLVATHQAHAFWGGGCGGGCGGGWGW